MSLPLHDPSLWPVRMTRSEVAQVLRISARTLRDRMRAARFPSPDDGISWDRDVVIRYVRGGVKAFEERAERKAQRSNLRVIGGRR